LISPPSETNKLIIIKNKRGYDIPRGHVNPMESHLSALVREVREEACGLIFPFVPV